MTLSAARIETCPFQLRTTKRTYRALTGATNSWVTIVSWSVLPAKFLPTLMYDTSSVLASMSYSVTRWL